MCIRDRFNRAAFGLKGSGNSFVRAITKILRPIREFTDSFVDDVAVHSDQWKEHMSDPDNFLRTVKEAGLTLNLKKCKWAQKSGQILRSNYRIWEKICRHRKGRRQGDECTEDEN